MLLAKIAILLVFSISMCRLLSMAMLPNPSQRELKTGIVYALIALGAVAIAYRVSLLG